MNKETKKISSIANELINYFFQNSAKNISLMINDKGDRSEINISSDDLNLTDEEVEKIIEYLNDEREVETEEYYWQIMGIDSEINEMAAIGTMVDEAIVNWNKPSIEIILIRYK
ncbi:hypothetical protein K8M07_08670 [Schnuerera sp. xch1]|uniref:hypothetical protein n=1 Tax=Schnuerera sp. xch1 TaxID=2874283 RepID=UPI001CC0A9F2|nr:hypothetical protein [Schnuerera sp. xch1]MBZ2175320.1 hypothetical protein [Schnuerera sp. xch1]